MTNFLNTFLTSIPFYLNSWYPSLGTYILNLDNWKRFSIGLCLSTWHKLPYHLLCNYGTTLITPKPLVFMSLELKMIKNPISQLSLCVSHSCPKTIFCHIQTWPWTLLTSKRWCQKNPSSLRNKTPPLYCHQLGNLAWLLIAALWKMNLNTLTANATTIYCNTIWAKSKKQGKWLILE